VTNAAEERTEEERAEKIAETLTGLGLDASAEDTGGGIVCVVIPHTDGGAISWGTADVTWGAVITNEDGEQVSSISTGWPSDSEDIAATAKALLDASLKNGALQAGA
jgi:AcrR family transcriptional regulator